MTAQPYCTLCGKQGHRAHACPWQVLRFGSVCSGIEAASVAFGPLGWQPAWLAEIEKFPAAVLAHHYPDVPNLGDMTKIARAVLLSDAEAPDVLCGGTPCQAFSVAGLRNSLADERGNLTLKFVELADAIDHVRARAGKPAAVIFWENVPGVLSTKDNAFGCFLAGLAGEDEPLVAPGGKWTNAGCVYGPKRAIAWRTVDAQYFRLAQRRRRVFVVASARIGFDPAQVLFEWGGVRRDIAPSREKGQVAPTVPARSTAGGGLGTDFDCDGGLVAYGGNRTSGPIDVSPALLAQPGSGYKCDFESETFVTHSLRGEGFDASEDGTGRGTHCRDVAGAITSNYGKPVDSSDTKTAVAAASQVRRLTPRECERLQGFQWLCSPDYPGAWQDSAHRWWSPDYTAISWRGKPADQCPDGPRYKALGNSWAVPVVAWIGRRINSHLADIDGRAA